MTDYIIAADITAALFLLVPIVATHATIKNMPAKTRSFLLCLWTCFIGLIFNALSYILSGNISSNFIVGAVNYLAFIFMDIVIASYGLYFYHMVKERVEDLPKGFVIYIFTLCTIDFLFLTIGAITKNLFTVENGTYIGGKWWDFAPIIPSICVLSFFGLLLFHHRKIGKIACLSLTSYLALTLICAIIQFIDVNAEFSYVGAAISLIIIYLMIQSRIVYDASIRAEIYTELSIVDVLTGLKNRRGFQLALEEYEKFDNVCSIFCDLNNLKLINDTLGHEAGDEYIQKFANMMLQQFPNDFTSRISGDEFVILINIDKKEELEERINEFARLISINNDIASMGYSIGLGKNIVNTIKESEKLMYEEKEKYYQKTGIKRR